MKLESKIEAILFWKGEPVEIKKLAEILSIDITEIKKSLENLRSALTDRGLTLLENDGAVTLGTHPDISETIEKLTKEELIRDLGKAGLETLSIILYKTAVTRAEIEYIRGVNSQFILRNLLVRGLIERITNPEDSRGFLYKPTFDLLAYLGINKVEELPNFDKLKSEIEGVHIQKDA